MANDRTGVLSLYKSGYALQVAITASGELYIVYLAVFYFEIYLSRACALGHISMFHLAVSFVFELSDHKISKKIVLLHNN